MFSSQAGFTLANGAVRCPDASWILIEKLRSLPAQEMEQFTHVCPDFVIEIRSKSESLAALLAALNAKMDEYIQNGVPLGFLIDSNELTAYLYRADGSIEKVAGMNAILTGEIVLSGFSLPLAKFAK